MVFRYGDYPTQKEIIHQARGAERAETLWEKVQTERQSKAEQLPLRSKEGKSFWFVITPYLLQLITRITEQKGFLEGLRIPSVLHKKLFGKAMNEEAYYSSHIEGAQSSLEEALRFIKKKQRYSPDESLQMIGNNQRALDYAMKQVDKPITHMLIWKLQTILTEHTHRAHPITRGAYRHGPVYIVNGLGQVIYEGPPYTKVPEMMEKLIGWINSPHELNPLLKAATVHLYFVHVHPFDDGNGRTARALANLILAKLGFPFINLLSLSSYFDHHRPRYYQAIQDVRGHAGDLTYFLIFFMEALLTKLEEVKKEIELITTITDIKRILPRTTYEKLHRRHVKALRVMLRNQEKMNTRKYCKINRCSDETARKDFSLLIKIGLLRPEGSGRSREYLLNLSV